MTSTFDPRLRVRARAARRTRAEKKQLSNAELLDAWYAAELGKLSETSRRKYRNCIRDALAFIREEEAGTEVHVSAWTADMVWD